MSDRANSFPPVKTSWILVAQRTLELFTQVRSTEEGKEWAPEVAIVIVGPGRANPRQQKTGTPHPIAAESSRWMGQGTTEVQPGQCRHSLRHAMESKREAVAGGMQLGNTGCST
jgi:hypothetical protein